MVGALAVGGLASGLDTNSLISKLLELEAQPLTRLETKRDEYNYKKEMIHEINMQTLDMQNSLFELTLEGTFMAMTTESSNSDVVSASAGINAIDGMQYIFENISLATQTVATSTDQLNTDTWIESSEAIGVIDTTKSFAEAGFSTTPTGKVFINGTEYNLDNYSTVDDFISAVNDNATIADFSYDSLSETFSIEAEPGENLTLYGEGTKNFFNVAKIDYVDPTANLADLNLSNGPVTDGFFKINGKSIYVNTTTDSINDVIKSINKSDAGVVAFYDSTSERINISSRETGNSAIVFDDNGTGFLNAMNLTDPSAQVLGNNAEFTLNGVATSRSSNTFSINDVEFTLKQEHSGTPVTVGTVADVEDTVAQLKNFVEQYNGLIENVYTRYSEDTVDSSVLSSTTDEEKYREYKKQGLLKRDTVLRDFHSTLKEVTSFRVGNYTLEELGIKSLGFSNGSITEEGKMGLLEFDEDAVREALKNDPEGVRDFFINKGGVTRARDNRTLDADSETVTLDHFRLTQSVSVMVNNELYTEVSDAAQFDEFNDVNEYVIDRRTGKITFETELLKGDTVSVDYSYINNAAREYTVDDEEVGTGNGATKTYKLDHRYINNNQRIYVDGVEYEQVASADQLTAPAQYYIDYDRGTISFSEAIADGEKITAGYSYYLADNGFANTLHQTLKGMTGIGVFYQSETDYDTLINRAQDDMSRLEERLAEKEDQLWDKYSRMETTLSNLQSQGQWLSSQLAKLG